MSNINALLWSTAVGITMFAGGLLSLSAGMMIYSALDTLAQSANERNSNRILYWLIGGMLFIAFVLVLSGHTY